jgi:FKBP-type peptidyl-prolyl cis-trans isomerase SlyD
MAGRSLTFDVEVTGVRDATDEEVSHGHVHGKGGIEH